MKRNHGSSTKPPLKYTEKEWASMKKYWESEDSKLMFERMSEARKKVVSNPGLGRHGYGGTALKLVRRIKSFSCIKYVLLLIDIGS